MDILKSSLNVVLQGVSLLLMFCMVGAVAVFSILYLNPNAREFKKIFGLYPDRKCGPLKANQILRKKFQETFEMERSLGFLAELEGSSNFMEQEVNSQLENEWESARKMARVMESNSYPLDETNKKYLLVIEGRVKTFVAPAA